MHPDKPLLIVNPRSGAGLSQAAWARLAGAISEGLGPFDTRMTERPGHAQDIAEAAARERRQLVVAVGGDGTLNEVVNGLMAAGAPKNTELALIPRGTGGDFRRTIEGSKDAVEAARHIRDAPAVAIDVGLIHFVDAEGRSAQRHFVNVSSFGFSAQVAHKANRSSKQMGAKAAFLGATVRTLIGHSNIDVQIAANGGEPVRRTVMLGAIGNGQYFGGGMRICPNAKLNSGAFEFVVVGDLTLATVATKIHRLYNGSHLSIDRIDSRSVHTLRVDPIDHAERIFIEVDGETAGYLPASWQVVPSALHMRL